MRLIIFIYLATTFGSIFTAFPQIKQLWRMKNSDEFNIFSWCAWAFSQLTALIYSVAIHSVPFILVNIGWLTYYVVILWLIFKYRNGGVRKVALQEVTVDNSEDNF